MSADARITQLVEEILANGCKPEELCAHEPELLPDVLARLNRLKQLDDVLRGLLPADTLPDLSPPPALAPKLPHIEGYEVQSVLGKGGMGIVFRAIHRVTNRTVALKKLRFASDGGSLAFERFKQEYKILAQLNHPRIVHVYDVGSSDDEPYFTMEFVPGETLESIVLKGPQNSLYAATLVEKLADAINAAHERGIIHRDLKPSNVLLTADEEPKISDFGLARAAHDGPTLTMTGVAFGTPSYMAPEQALGNKADLGVTADVYALGAILYALLTGRPPFCGESSADTIHQILTTDPVPPSRLNANVSRDLETICLKCLEKEAKKRYPSAAVLAHRLRRFLDGKPIPERPIGSIERGWRWCRRNPSLAAAIGISTLLIFALVFVSLDFGIREGRISEKLRTTLRKSQLQETLATWDYGRQLCESGEIAHGVLVLAAALESVPESDIPFRQALEIELNGWHTHCHTLQNVFAHPRAVLCLAVSPNGELCATGCADGVIRLCQLDTGACREIARQEDVRTIGFLADGHTVVAGGADSELVLWDTRTGQDVGRLVGHTGPIRAVAVSADGERALTGSLDGDARLWHLPSRSTRAVVKHGVPVLAVALSPDGETIFSGGGSREQGGFRLDRVSEANVVSTVFCSALEMPVRSAAFSPDGKTLVVGDEDWETGFWDVESRSKIASTDFTQGTVRSLGFAPAARDDRDQLVLVGADESGIAMLWNVSHLRTHWELQEEGQMVLLEGGTPAPLVPTVPHPQSITAVAFVPPAGDRFVTASEDGYVRLWRRSQGWRTTTVVHDTDRENVQATAIAPDGTLVATAGANGQVKVWRADDGQPVGEPFQSSDSVRGVAFMNEGTGVVVGSEDGSIRIWDLRTRKEASQAGRYSPGISAFCLTPRGDELLVGGGGQAQRWTLAPLEPVGKPLLHARDNRELSIGTAVSPRHDRSLTVGQDGSAILWNQAGSPIAKLEHQNEVRSGAFSADGFWFITASDDKTARVWNAATGAHITTLSHPHEVFAVAFTDDQRVITGSRHTAQLWDLRYQRRLGPACRIPDDVLCLAVSADRKLAVLGDGKGRGIIWQLPQPGLPDEQHPLNWIESQVGMRLEKGRGRNLLSGDEWLKRHRPETAPPPATAKRGL